MGETQNAAICSDFLDDMERRAWTWQVITSLCFPCQEIKRGNMLQRWAVAALHGAEKRFKPVKAYREIPKFVAALQQKNLDRLEVAALE